MRYCVKFDMNLWKNLPWHGKICAVVFLPYLCYHAVKTRELNLSETGKIGKGS